MMDSVLSAGRSTNHENLSCGLSPTPSPKRRREDTRQRPLTIAKNEKHTPSSLPTGLNRMLKTTTETGDIGQFAVKPSRLPPSRDPNGPWSDFTFHKPKQTAQLQDGQQEVDDRRRLPSYTRNATSDIVSMHETASQKVSGRPQVLENPDHRSYSMTQTSYSSNALSNHRSYASLRSQPELGLLPRPRSPFLYPARLKRLGFRPPSPVPIEAVRADSVQITELGRTPDTTASSARSVFSPHNPILPFPSTVQSGLKNTYSPALGRLPSGSRSYTPPLRSAMDPPQDRAFRQEATSLKSSPTGNNFRSASTPISYHRRSPNSLTSATGKSHTPSPLYYDYTEDFNIKEAAVREITAGENPSPITAIQNNIAHEGRETPFASLKSVDLRSLATVSNTDSFEASDDKPGLNSEDSQAERSTNVTQDIIPLYLDRRPCGGVIGDPLDHEDFATPDEFVSTLDGNLQLSSDLNNAFSPNFLGAVNQRTRDFKTSPSQREMESSHLEHGNESTSVSERTSSFRLSAYLPMFPTPPDQKLLMIVDSEPKSRVRSRPAAQIAETVTIRKTREPAGQAPGEGSAYGESIEHSQPKKGAPLQSQIDLPTGSLQSSPTTQDRRVRSSRYYSIDHGLSDLAQLITNFEFANGPFVPQDVYTEYAESTRPLLTQPTSSLPTSGVAKDSLIPPTKELLHLSHPLESHKQITKIRSESDLRALSSKSFKVDHYTWPEKFTSLDNHGPGREESESYCNNVSRQIPNGPPSHSESPLLAPKAVSPARVLRLKNSVPQLMKALPPVPQDQKFESSSAMPSPPHQISHTCPPLNLQQREISTSIEPYPAEAATFRSRVSQQDFEDVTELEQTLPPPPKLRCKSKHFDAQRSHSPANSRPWNLDENYPWYGQQSSIRLPSLRSMIPRIQRSPKFKLRLTKAPKSPSGTIRITPDARCSLDFHSPRDLFTSTSNLSGIFRQVGRQFSSRKSSAISETAPGNIAQVPLMPLASTHINYHQGHNPDLLGPPSPPMAANATSPTEVQSFFSEDSSQIRGHHSFRKRISNLRARIPHPHLSRPIAQLNDNESWREHVTRDAPASGLSIANANFEQEDEYGMPIASLRHQNLRLKVSRWFTETGLAMKRGVKLHKSEEGHCITYR